MTKFFSVISKTFRSMTKKKQIRCAPLICDAKVMVCVAEESNGDIKAVRCWRKI